MYCSSVWKDKPLLRLPIADIEQILIIKDDNIKQKNPVIKFIFHIYFKFDSGKFLYKLRGY